MNPTQTLYQRQMYTLEETQIYVSVLSFSCFCCVLVIVYYFFDRSSQSIGYFLIMVSQALTLVFEAQNLVTYALYLGSNRTYSLQQKSAACQFIGIFNTMSQESIIYIDLVFLYTMYKTVYLFESIDEKHVKQLVAASIIFPLVNSSLLAPFYLYQPNSHQIECDDWDAQLGVRITLNLLYFEIPYFTLLALYLIIFIAVLRRFHGTALGALERIQKHTVLFLCVSYPTVSIVCWLYVRLNEAFGSFGNYNSKYQSLYNCLRKLSFLNGILNAVMFFVLVILQRRMHKLMAAQLASGTYAPVRSSKSLINLPESDDTQLTQNQNMHSDNTDKNQQYLLESYKSSSEEGLQLPITIQEKIQKSYANMLAIPQALQLAALQSSSRAVNSQQHLSDSRSIQKSQQQQSSDSTEIYLNKTSDQTQ